MQKINVGILFLACLSAGALCAADRAGTQYLVTDEVQVPEGDEVWEIDGRIYGYKPIPLQQPY